ncbi:helix-turn-helix transcriptional regulator [Pseudoalteromonas sp. SMS1]|uniref:helix-turn-helix domain-containing protein n=1 Tax=Pseudoalteromonas sp. SMS1 TaxID=2908894 RepID=UPI001F2C950A|nr:helix-turn-helix transcriptional regulator [Pseudoalteromonas sp. SMS1]MCF2859228.1 helix-turn-helix transcriptional regulator [Pseudoalteromonas sp. SMS1]
MDVLDTVIYSSMWGVILLALVQAVNKPKQPQTTYLITLLVLLLIHVSGELVIYTGAYQYFPALVGMQMPIRILLGPALFFYACATMSPTLSISKKSYAYALIGPAIAVLVMLPFVVGFTSAEKLALADPATRNPEHFKVALYTCIANMVVFMVFNAFYFIKALQVHTRHRQQLMERFAEIQSRSLDWFRIMLLMWGIVWLCYSLSYIPTLTGWRLPWLDLLPFFEATVLLAFAQLALNQPILSKEDKGLPVSAQLRSATLSQEKMDVISGALKNIMKEKQLFMDYELSLNKLSKAIGVSENHISETLSQSLETNFFQFVNGYRISEAKKRLVETDKRVSTIQYEVGFNSKSTFNTAFKKSTGLTPSLYRKQAT